MQVHVSRSAYRLIYGEEFLAKERGTTEVHKSFVAKLCF
jgi:hypothetical protein